MLNPVYVFAERERKEEREKNRETEREREPGHASSFHCLSSSMMCMYVCYMYYIYNFI